MPSGCANLIPATGVPDSIFKWKAGGFSPREPVMFFDGARLEAVGRWSGVTRAMFLVEIART